MQPIWKDYIFTAQGDSVDYTVSLDGNIIYTGRAYRKPGAAQVEWSINSIAANYLRNKFPELLPAGVATHTGTFGGGIRHFVVAYLGASVGINFSNDWSFMQQLPSEYPLAQQSLQLFDTVDIRLPLVVTQIREQDETQWNYVWTFARRGVFSYVDFAWYVGEDTCYRYALYFLNAFGGWSFIYLEAVKAMQAYDRKTAKYSYNSADLAARGTVNYVNEITARWTAKTPYLTDEQAAKMWHVAGTTSAYLFDMETQQLTPVNVENANWEQQTYRNRGIQRPRYDLTLALAQDRIRR